MLANGLPRVLIKAVISFQSGDDPSLFLAQIIRLLLASCHLICQFLGCGDQFAHLSLEIAHRFFQT